MEPSFKIILATALLSLSTVSQALQAAQPLIKCDDGYSDGYDLVISGDDEGLTDAKLSLDTFVEVQDLATMACRNHEIDPVLTDGPWIVATCNTFEWVDRYNVDYIVSGFSPAKAVVYYNEQELVTLTCREVQ